MIFGEVDLRDAEGAILAHAQSVANGRIAKGTRLGASEIERLDAAGVRRVVAARLGPGDVAENEAAALVGEALAGPSIEAATAATGRVNLYAARAGLFLPDRAAVDRLNAVDPALTLATLPEFEPVEAGRMVATVKIIPLAVPGAAVGAARAVALASPVLCIRPFRARPVGLVQTVLPATKTGVLDKTREATAARLARAACPVLREDRPAHRVEDLASALAGAGPGEEMTIVFGASAVIDAEDVVPAAIRRAGGRVEALGMPVDPGNLLLLGRIGGRVVIGAPGCARSPRENGFDWVLNRLLADLDVSQEDLSGLGVGGLLMEIAMRGHPREGGPVTGNAAAPKIDVVLLAAGRSSRMGGPNKLMATFDGVPLVRRSAETALGGGARRVHVVVGHREAEVRGALRGLDVRFVSNPRFAEGLSTSLKAGFAEAVEAGADGVLVMLADQPLLRAADLVWLISEFEPEGEGAIVMASDGGRRANPVILSAAFGDEVARLEGDVGARSVVERNRDRVRLVELGAAASFDVDTPDLMRRAGGILPDGA